MKKTVTVCMLLMILLISLPRAPTGVHATNFFEKSSEGILEAVDLPIPETSFEVKQIVHRQGDDAFCSIAADNFTLYLAWHSNYLVDYQIWFSTYDGNNWSKPTQLTSQGKNKYPYVLPLKDGRILVAWTSFRDEVPQIYYKIYNGTWSDDKKLTDGKNWHVYSPITQLKDGSIGMVYTSNESGNEDVWFAKYEITEGGNLHQKFMVKVTNANSTMWLYSRSVIQTPDGRIWVFVYDLHNFNFTTNIGGITRMYYYTSDDGGYTWTEHYLAEGSGFGNPSSTFLPDGSIVVVFTGDDLERNIPFTLWHMTYKQGQWTSPKILTPNEYFAVPSVTFFNGNLYVAYQTWSNETYQNELFLMEIPVNAVPNHDPIVIIGDNAFTPENGVIAGSGTKDDPYIIANWKIRATGDEPFEIGTTGIFIANTTKYFVIRNVTIFSGDFGIMLDNVSNFIIEDNKFYNINSYAIVAGGVTYESLAFNGTIRNNEAWDVDSFAWAEGSNFTIEDNYAHDLEVKSGAWSIGIGVAANNSIVRNNDIHDINVANGENGEKHYAHGIFIGWANNVSVYNNTIINMTIPDWGVHGIATSHAVNVKIYNNTVKNIDDNGISLFEGSKNILVNNNLIENCRIRNILVYGALDSNITIRGNVLRNANDVAGIGIEHSSDVFVMDNEIYGSKNRGIHLLNSTLIRIINNNIHDNLEGIRIEHGSDYAYLENNRIYSNYLHGLSIYYAKHATLRNNTLENNKYALDIWSLYDPEGFIHDIDTSNLIDGKPVYYWVGMSNMSVPSDASYIGLINCYNITVEGLTLTHNGNPLLIVNTTNSVVRNILLKDNEFSVDLAYASDVKIENITIINSYSAIPIMYSKNITVRNATIHNSDNAGIFLYSSSNVVVESSEVSNTTNGIELHYSTNNIIRNNSIHHNRDRGIALWDFSENNLIKGNDVYLNNGYGISLDAGNNIVRNNKVHDNNGDGIISANSNENQIIKNEIWNNFAGVRFWNSNYTLIRENEVHNNYDTGIYADNSFHGVIEWNEVYNNSAIGIGFWRSGNMSIIGDVVYKNGFGGIVSGHGSNATLIENVVFNNNATGVETREGSHIQIINATVYGNAYAGIVVIHPGTFALIENSTVYENTWRGIEFHDGGYGVVKKSRIFNNSIDGIYIANTGNVTIIESNISNNNACGIAADYTENIILLNSIIKDNRGSGIGFDNSFNAVIKNNIVYRNKDIGIGFWRSGNFSIIGNTLYENGFAGIVSGHGSNATLKDNVIFLNNASGIEVWEGSHLQIINATVYNNSHAGIWVIDPGTFALIENSTVHENAWRGIEFHDGGYGVVKSSRIFNNSIDGIYILNTKNVTVIHSNISKNNASGLAVDNSHCIKVVHSIFESNGDNGIKMYNVSNASIQESIFRDNRNLAGIWIDQVLNSVIGNNFFENNRIGLGLGYANGNTIRDNTFVEDGIFIWYPSTNTFENNTVNGKPILYYENLQNTNLDGVPAGQLILMNPVNVTVKNLNISDVAIGIELIGGHDNKVIDNYLLDTWDGINIRYSHNIKVQNNTLVRNGWIFLRKVTSSEIVDNYINGTDSGVFMTEGSEHNIVKNNWISSGNCPFVILESNHNAIYLNSIYGDKAYIRNSSVIWKSPAPLEYIYKNQTLTGYLGNYWSNYNGTDMNNDGISDSPWFIDSENADEYPLISPADEYKIKAIKTDFVIYVRTRDSKILKIWPSGFVQETPFYDSSYSLEIIGDRLYTQDWMYYGRAIKVYDLKNESLITTIPVPEGVSGLTFVAIPGGRIAFLNNAEDRVYIISPNGTLLANISIKEQPDNHLQVMDGIVVENKLIISEDGDKNIFAIDLNTYEKTIFKNLSYVPGWLGSITYHNGTFYVASSQTIYQFTEDSNATAFTTLPEGNIVGITTFGRYLYAAVNFGGKVYRIDLQTKEYKVVADNLHYPTDLELWAILQSEKIKGDANGDGRITATDALLYLRFAVGLDISPYHLDPVADDLTGDGRITAVDALKVLRIAVGLESS